MIHIHFRVSTSLLLGGLISTLIGCTGKTPETAAEAASLEACVTAGAGAGFANAALAPQSGRFVLDALAVPQGPEGVPIDAVAGVSAGAADAFTDLAAIVRFNDQGAIDVRRGSEYTSDVDFPYHTNAGPYRFVFDIDTRAHVYSVWAKSPDGLALPTVKIATAYPFRTEQASVSLLDNIAAAVDSAQGSVNACAAEVGTCAPASAGTGWSAQPFPARSGVFRVELDAEALDAPIDGVVGLASGAPSAFRDLAANIRFNPDGRLDARNGGAYSADAVIPYRAGERFHVTFDVNRPAARYSVAVERPNGESFQLATDYAFRTEQTAVAELDHIGGFVDSAQGEELVCNPAISE